MQGKSIQKKKILIILIFVVLAVDCMMLEFIFSLCTPGGQYRRNLNLGHKYLLAMNYEEAVNAFTKAIDVDPKKTDAYIGRGDAYAGWKKDAEAQNDYEKALSISPGLADEIQEKIAALTDTSGASTRSDDSEGSDNTLSQGSNNTLSRDSSAMSTQSVQHTFTGAEEILPNVDNSVSLLSDGVQDTVSYSYELSQDNAITNLYLTVNGNENMLSFLNEYGYSEAVSVKVYAADLNTEDNCYNFVINAELMDDAEEFYLYTCKDGMCNLIKEVSGKLAINELTGDGKIISYHPYVGLHWGVEGEGFIDYRETRTIEDEVLSDPEMTAGITDYTTAAETFTEGFTATAIAEIPLYSDEDCANSSGTIPSGSTLNFYEYKYDMAQRFTHFHVKTDNLDGWIDSKVLQNSVDGFQAAQ